MVSDKLCLVPLYHFPMDKSEPFPPPILLISHASNLLLTHLEAQQEVSFGISKVGLGWGSGVCAQVKLHLQAISSAR